MRMGLGMVVHQMAVLGGSSCVAWGNAWARAEDGVFIPLQKLIPYLFCFR